MQLLYILNLQLLHHRMIRLAESFGKNMEKKLLEKKGIQKGIITLLYLQNNNNNK